MITWTSQIPSREGKQRSCDVINSSAEILTQKAQSVGSSLEMFELFFDNDMFGLILDKTNIRISDGMNTLQGRREGTSNVAFEVLIYSSSTA